MKALILISIGIALCTLSFCQTDSNSVVTKRRVAGVYKWSKEFLADSPAIKKDIIVKANYKYKKNGDSVLTDYDFIVADGSSHGRYWGFCDGQDVYIKLADGSLFKKNLKLEHLGKHAFASININRINALFIGPPGINLIVGAATLAASAASPAEDEVWVLQSSGRFEKVGSGYIKNLCKKHPALFEELKKEGEIDAVVLKKYLVKLDEFEASSIIK